MSAAAGEALVCFRVAGAGRYALRVSDAGAVLPRGEVDPLPAPRAGVLGLLRIPGGVLPVLAPWGDEGRHIVVLGDGDRRFGLLVEEVTEVVRVPARDLGPAPAGQERRLVSAVAQGAGGGALVLDPVVLAEPLLG